MTADDDTTADDIPLWVRDTIGAAGLDHAATESRVDGLAFTTHDGVADGLAPSIPPRALCGCNVATNRRGSYRSVRRDGAEPQVLSGEP